MVNLIQDLYFILCISRKYLYFPHRWDWDFLGVGGFCKTQKFKEMYKASIGKFRGMGGDYRQNPLLLGSCGIFSGTANCPQSVTAARKCPYLQ